MFVFMLRLIRAETLVIIAETLGGVAETLDDVAETLGDVTETRGGVAETLGSDRFLYSGSRYNLLTASLCFLYSGSRYNVFTAVLFFVFFTAGPASCFLGQRSPLSAFVKFLAQRNVSCMRALWFNPLCSFAVGL